MDLVFHVVLLIVVITLVVDDTQVGAVSYVC